MLRTSRSLADFKRDDIDLAIRFAPGPGRGLHGELLCGEELFPVASPRLFGGGRTPDTLAALAGVPAAARHRRASRAAVDELARMVRARGSRRRAGSARHAVHGLHRVDRRGCRGARVALGRGPHVAQLLARGQLVRVTQESWRAPWSYFLVAPAAHFRRPVVRAFVDWALAEARDEAAAA